MASKRKSVTFRQNVSVVYPKTFDGSSSPAPINTTPATALPSLQLDPMYLTWLRSATKAQYPFIVNGTFAKYVYHQNFDQHYNMKHSWHFQKVQEREAAVPALAEKYGSLGWGNLYQRVTKEAWVKNYREIYRFDGSDEQLLEKIAEAYDEIKRTIAEEEKANAQFTQDGSIFTPPSDLQWETFTQGGGALVSPNSGPGGMGLAFDDTVDAPFDLEESVRFRPRSRGGNGDEMPFNMGDLSSDFRNAMVGTGTEVRMLSEGSEQSRMEY